MDAFQEIPAYFNKEKDAFFSLLKQLVEYETPSNEKECFTGIMELLKEEFTQLDYKVEKLKGNISAGQLLCRPTKYDAGKPQQLIVGHIDTVWAKGTLEEMPFRIEEDVATGPGIYDMKTGVCMMVFAIRALQELNIPTEVQPVFLITTDEETGSDESKDVIVEEAKKSERCFVLEPALDREGKIKTSRKGVGHFEITIKGKPSHAGLEPEKGVSAILGLSHIVQQLFRLNDPTKGITVNVGTIEGGERSNVIAAKSKAIVDVRVETRSDGKRIVKEIQQLKPEIEGIELKVEGGINRPPMEKTEKNEHLWTITKTLGKKLGISLKEGMSGGASDGNFTNQYSPTLDGMGAVGEGAHAYHEKIFISETLERASLFTLWLMQGQIDFENKNNST